MSKKPRGVSPRTPQSPATPTELTVAEKHYVESFVGKGAEHLARELKVPVELVQEHIAKIPSPPPPPADRFFMKKDGSVAMTGEQSAHDDERIVKAPANQKFSKCLWKMRPDEPIT